MSVDKDYKENNEDFVDIEDSPSPNNDSTEATFPDEFPEDTETPNEALEFEDAMEESIEEDVEGFSDTIGTQKNDGEDTIEEDIDINGTDEEAATDIQNVETEEFKELKIEYFDDLKQKSEYPDTIDESLMDKEWSKITPELNGEMRDEFSTQKKDLIDEWEQMNDTKWPTYTEDVYSSSGKCIRHVGDRYDAHHIQPLTYGGKNEPSNITPLHASVHFDKQGIHAPDSPFGKMEKTN